MPKSIVLLLVLFCDSVLAFAEDPPLDVVPADVLERQTACVFDFTEPSATLDDWFCPPTVSLSLEKTGLLAKSSAKDPCFISPDLSALNVEGDFLVKITGRRTTTGFAQVFVSERDAEFSETTAPRFAMDESGGAREYSVVVHTSSPLKRLRFDLGLDAGEIEVSKIEIVHIEYSPIKFGVFTISNGKLRTKILYSGKERDSITIESNGVSTTQEVASGDEVSYEVEFPRVKPFESVDVTAALGSGRSTTRRFYAFHEDVCASCDMTEWTIVKNDRYEIRVAPDCSGADVLRRDGEDCVRAAVLTPLVCPEDGIARVFPNDALSSNDTANVGEPTFMETLTTNYGAGAYPGVEVRFEIDGQEGSLTLNLEEDKIVCLLDSPARVHAPVVRVLGAMEQAVLPGVEYLERGERSSSTLDVNPLERARFAPPRMSVTGPYSAVVTNRGSFACVVSDVEARVSFASPDFLDGDENSTRVDYCAQKFGLFMRFAPIAPIEDSISWALKQFSWPTIPRRPRTTEEEDALHLAAFNESALKKKNGWAMAVGPGEESEEGFYCSDFLSTIGEITGDVPKTPHINVGGAQLRNYSSLLLTNNGELMKSWINGEAANIRAAQKEDGSFRYEGRYLQGSDVDYASGDCAKYVFRLLDHWRLTGNLDSLTAGLKGVDFINTLRTPRGAQTWELSLHTPDLVASSRCCACNTLAYAATGEERYLVQARRWAISGLAFVYLWEARGLPSREPVMLYASIPVFGTTDWIAPCWIGTPVQWCGLDYADALLELARYDRAGDFDWKTLADGLVTCAERQEYVDGPFVGLLPDSYTISAQQRNALNINPCVVHMLRRKLDGEKFTGVSVVDVAGHKVAAPYPAVLNSDKGNLLIVKGKKGTTYQILIDGKELKTIESVGDDFVRFEN